jgi:dTDP-4-dehydrorhamnose reductase
LKIIVLGERGMLGQMAVRYFHSRGAEVLTIAERFNFSAECPILAKLAAFGPSLVLNCVGRIKQKDAGRQDLFDVNSVLPLQIYERLGEGQFLIQPSTDCVFSGQASKPYEKSDHCDATDDYGWSKRLGEVALIGKPKAAVVRVSIIGPDSIDPAPRGLLGWFLSQPEGSTLTGYQNHHWNGITTLEWCRIVEQLFIENCDEHRQGALFQLGTDTVYTKFEMLGLFQSIYATRHTINPAEVGADVYRVLKPDCSSPPLIDQLNELKSFWDSTPIDMSL